MTSTLNNRLKRLETTPNVSGPRYCFHLPNAMAQGEWISLYECGVLPSFTIEPQPFKSGYVKRFRLDPVCAGTKEAPRGIWIIGSGLEKRTMDPSPGTSITENKIC